MRVTVIGIGRMGRALVERLVGSGHDVTVWNRSRPAAEEAAAELGAQVADAVADAVVACDVAITALANDDAVRAVVLGDGGVVGSLPGGAVLADASTVSPGLSAEVATAVGPDRMVAMPILGAPSAVVAGTAVYLAGGTPVALDRLQPVLGTLAATVHRYPRPELATTAKVTSNFLLLSGLAALAEAFAIGRRGGLDDDQLRALLADGPMVAPGVRNRFEALLGGHHDGWWSVALGAKDASLALGVGRSDDGPLVVAEAVHRQYREAAARFGDGDPDITVVGALYRS
jgi:3-hydroxyisobutyrate dehydrogenase-like beta-hydroxyacid dehydrogenase